MLSLNTTNKVTFNVNVFGTAATPTVRCVVGEAPGFSFPATKLADGQYEVLIDLPKDLRLGAYQFKVEVLLNGRLFTPINHSVAVTGPEAPEEPAASNPTPEPVPTVEPAAEPLAAVAVEPVAKPAEPLVSPLIAAVTMKKNEAKAPVEEKVEEKVEGTRTTTTLSGLKTLAKTPVFSKPKVTTETKLSKISMADVSAAAEAIERPKKAPKAAPKKVAEAITPTVPVSLIKGAVIYR